MDWFLSKSANKRIKPCFLFASTITFRVYFLWKERAYVTFIFLIEDFQIVKQSSYIKSIQLTLLTK